jgi:hypothetical protein
MQVQDNRVSGGLQAGHGGGKDIAGDGLNSILG